MAMIPCKECGEIFSDKLKTCPQCGHPPKAVELPMGLAIVAAILGIVGLVWSALLPFLIASFWWGLGITLRMGLSRCMLLFLSFGLIFDLIVVALASIAIYMARRGEAGSKGIAKAGLVCGVVGIVIMVFWSILILSAGPSFLG